MFEEGPFSSCKVVYPHSRIGQLTCLQIVHDKLGWKKFHLCRVPRALLINQKSESVSYSKLLLTELMEQKASSFHRIISGDESRFFFYYPRDLV
jgi:hypothetical protein